MAIGLTLLMPAAGLYGMTELLRGVPAEFLTGIRMLALFGALYGSLKALATATGDSVIGLRRGGLLLCSLVAYGRHSGRCPHKRLVYCCRSDFSHRRAFTGNVLSAGALWRRWLLIASADWRAPCRALPS